MRLQNKESFQKGNYMTVYEWNFALALWPR